MEAPSRRYTYVVREEVDLHLPYNTEDKTRSIIPSAYELNERMIYKISSEFRIDCLIIAFYRCVEA